MPAPAPISLLAAAAAWDQLAAQLRSTAASYSSALSNLTADWQGPSSEAMTAAAAPYAAWVKATAAQAEQSANQARAAAAAYEAAFAATVPPSVIAANRASLASLIATNVFGQNLSAIAANEAQYADMWAQDAAAMYGYAGQSAAALQVTPFSPPPQTTDPGGLAAQAAATTGATGSSTGSGAQSVLSQLTSSLQSLAAPDGTAQSTDTSGLSLFLRDVVNPFGSLSPINKGAELFEFPATAALPARNALVSSTLGFALATRGFSTGELPVPLLPGVPLPPIAAAASAVSAGVSRAGVVGALSVPPSWAAATPAVRLAAAVLQGAGSAGAPAVAAAGESIYSGRWPWRAWPAARWGVRLAAPRPKLAPAAPTVDRATRQKAETARRRTSSSACSLSSRNRLTRCSTGTPTKLIWKDCSNSCRRSRACTRCMFRPAKQRIPFHANLVGGDWCGVATNR